MPFRGYFFAWQTFSGKYHATLWQNEIWCQFYLEFYIWGNFTSFANHDHQGSGAKKFPVSRGNTIYLPGNKYPLNKKDLHIYLQWQLWRRWVNGLNIYPPWLWCTEEEEAVSASVRTLFSKRNKNHWILSLLISLSRRDPRRMMHPFLRFYNTGDDRCELTGGCLSIRDQSCNDESQNESRKTE